MSILSKTFEVGFKAAGYDKKALNTPEVQKHLKIIQSHRDDLNTTYGELEELTGIDLSDVKHGIKKEKKEGFGWFQILLCILILPLGLLVILAALRK